MHKHHLAAIAAKAPVTHYGDLAAFLVVVAIVVIALWMSGSRSQRKRRARQSADDS